MQRQATLGNEPPASPLREMLTIALPVAAVMISYTASQFVDRVMVARLPDGDAAVSALGNGGIVAFVPISITMGMLTVINTYVSQHVGAGRERSAAAYPCNGVWLAGLVWLAVFIPLSFALPALLPAVADLLAHARPAEGHAGLDPGVLRMQEDYARILLLGSIFTLASRAMAQFFFGLHKGAVILLASLLANLVNAGGNWLLIYGNWGFPMLGVRGAAISTVVGQAVELAIPLAVFLSAKVHARYGTRSAWRFSPARVREIVRIGWPQGLAFGNEMICWAVFMAGIIGSISVADNAAGWIALGYMQISFMPAVGISIAVTAVVGRCIGAGQPDVAASRAYLGARVAMVYMGACAACFVLFRHQLVGVFINEDWSPERAADVMRIGAKVMICAAVFQLFDAVGITMFGALRGAGDSRWPGLATVLMSWTVILGGGIGLLRLMPDQRSLGPWIAASAYIILFALVMFLRFRSGSWRRIHLVRRRDEPVVPEESSAEIRPPFGTP